MAVYNRIYCPVCKKEHNVYNDNLKVIPCTRCHEAVIVKGQNNYFIEYYVDGRRKREKISSSKILAETVLKKRLVEIAENKHLDVKKEEKIKFEDFADEYLELHSKVNNKSWQTFDLKNIIILKRFFSGRYLHEITPRLIEQFKAERAKTVMPATINRSLACLKSMYNKAIAWKRFAGPNPVREVKLYKENNQRLRFLEKEEIGRLLVHCDGFLRPLVIVALNTGMRLGELRQLKWRDVDYKREIIYLRDTKNGEAREIPMNEYVKNAFVAIPKSPDSQYVFCKHKGGSFGDIRKTFWTALKKSGIVGFHFHDLRHTFASHLVMSGHDLNTVRELLGHKTIQMTLRYAHLSPKHKKHAVDSLGKVLDTIWTPKEKESSMGSNNILVSISNK